MSNGKDARWDEFSETHEEMRKALNAFSYRTLDRAGRAERDAAWKNYQQVLLEFEELLFDTEAIVRDDELPELYWRAARTIRREALRAWADVRNKKTFPFKFSVDYSDFENMMRLYIDMAAACTHDKENANES